MQIRVDGSLPVGVTPKDLILAIIGEIGTSGGSGYVIEYTGSAIAQMSMEGRMTVCNMSIEAGARAGLISPDEATCEYLRGRPYLSREANWQDLVQQWRSWASDPGCSYDATVTLDAAAVEPQVTWGTTPAMVTTIRGRTPVLAEIADADQRQATAKALAYMGLGEGVPIEEIAINRVFIGSCTNGRIEDLREAARVVSGYRLAEGIEEAIVVPGSHQVKDQAEREGLDRVFREAGFEWREAGCSMCLGMNPDQLRPGDRCASTSNRNFEGRQGKGGRTHLVSPAMAAAAAVRGRLTDVRGWQFE
jgi:3-isopropylmalate/(R)-2-methylmalate dehydratase large subunit